MIFTRAGTAYSGKEGERASLVTWVSCQQVDTARLSRHQQRSSGYLEALYPGGIPFCEGDTVCVPGGGHVRISINDRRTLPALGPCRAQYVLLVC